MPLDFGNNDYQRIRVMFRFLFTLPLLIIAIDGIHMSFLIVTNSYGFWPLSRSPLTQTFSFALDFLLMMGGIGCFVSSAITLLVRR